MSSVVEFRKKPPSLHFLIADLQRTTDLVVMDVVVDLESRPATFRARIVIKGDDKPAMEDWLRAFGIDGAEWAWTGGYDSHWRVSFPITVMGF